MEITPHKRTTNKRIIFNIDVEDHEKIRQAAARNGLSMRVFIINAIAEVIRRDDEYRNSLG